MRIVNDWQLNTFLFNLRMRMRIEYELSFSRSNAKSWNPNRRNAKSWNANRWNANRPLFIPHTDYFHWHVHLIWLDFSSLHHLDYITSTLNYSDQINVKINWVGISSAASMSWYIVRLVYRPVGIPSDWYIVRWPFISVIKSSPGSRL